MSEAIAECNGLFEAVSLHVCCLFVRRELLAFITPKAKNNRMMEKEGRPKLQSAPEIMEGATTNVK
jgi:hypothetical protein